MLGVVCVSVIKWHSGDGSDLTSTLSKYDGGVRSILLLPLVARFLDTICLYIVCSYVWCSDCMGVCRNVHCVAGVVEDSVFLLWSVEVCCKFV